jgi:hypothetical protein
MSELKAVDHVHLPLQAVVMSAGEQGQERPISKRDHAKPPEGDKGDTFAVCLLARLARNFAQAGQARSSSAYPLADRISRGASRRFHNRQRRAESRQPRAN